MRIILILCVFLSSCYNKDLTSIINDIDSTPKCDTRNIYLHPEDTKKTLVGKIIILNSMVDCSDDTQTVTDKKIKSYKDL